MAMLNFLPKRIQMVERPQEPARPFEPVAIANPPEAWIELGDEPARDEETAALEVDETHWPDGQPLPKKFPEV